MSISDTGTLDFKVGPGRIWIPATAFVASAAGPALEVVDTIHHGFLLDTVADEAISTAILMPQYWSSVNIDVYGYNAGAGAGGVALGYYLEDLEEAAVLTTETPTVAASAVFTAEGEDELDIIQLARAVAVTPGAYTAIKIGRIVGNAGDTLANDFGILGIAIEVNGLS